MRTTSAEPSGHSVRTACPLDCPDACTLDVTVEKGRIVKIDGGHANPVTRGYICAKVRRFTERLYGEDRLLYPAVRQGAKGQGTFARVTWDEALDQIARRMEKIRDTTGAEAILPFCYGGSNGLLTQDTNDATLFRAFGTSRLARTVCAAPTGAANQALYGKMAGRHLRRLRPRKTDCAVGRESRRLRYSFNSLLEAGAHGRSHTRGDRSAHHVAGAAGRLASRAPPRD